MAVGISNYPASLDTVVELVEAANNAADTLNGGIDAIVTTLTVNDASEFAASGIVAIDDELVSYTGKSGNDLTGLTRGIEGTLAASHSSGADVRQVITASSHNVQSAAIIALETKLGTGTDIAWSQMVPLTANRLVVTDGTGDVTASPITHDATDAILGNVGGIDFDTTPTGTVQTARLQWNDTDGTLDLGLKGGAVTLQVGQEHLTRVVNKTGDDLLESEFRVIRAGASAGVNRIGGYLAQANTEANSTDVLGIVTENIAKNQEGFVTTWGEVRQVDTTGAVYGETWNEGDTLYLSPNTFGGKAGALTNVKPKGPNHLVIVGYVISKNANNGRILVHVQSSWETNELHDVNITGTPSAGQLLIRDATTNVWKNANLTAGTNVTITNADGAITINATSSGDVAGPASSTDNALARFDGTTGKLIQNSNVTLSDTGAFSFPDGVRQTFNPNGTNAGINVGAHTSDPSSATNGDLWYNSASNLLKTRRGGASEIVATIPTTAGVDEIAIVGGSGGGLTTTTDLAWDASFNVLQIGSTSSGGLRLLYSSGTDGIELYPPSTGGLVSLTLPAGYGTNGQSVVTDGAGNTSWATRVSSVTGTSPVASSGGATPAISLASGYGDTQNPYGSKTANHFLAAPNGTAGAPSFRAIVAADVPTLNQNTTGTASNVTGVVAVVNGGTGVTTSTGSGSVVLSTSPSLTTPSLGVATGTSFNSITGLSSTTPAANSGAGSVGTGTTVARADHAHPTTGLGLTSGTLAQFAATTSSQLAGVISDETGSGALVFGTSPTLTTPTIAKLANLTANGFVKTSGGDGTLSVDTNTYLTGNQTITLSGDATGSGTTSIPVTLANSGVTVGTYKSVTVDVKGRVTAGTNPTTLAGYGITDAQPLDSDLTAIAALTADGLLRKTSGTWGMDSSAYLTSVNLATNVTGTLPAANGGTGLTSPGTLGNVLTSNGSAWVSSAPTGTTLAEVRKYTWFLS
jgi:hypothetical protein